MSYAALIKEIGRGPKGSRPITTEQAEALFGAMLDGQVPDLELGAIILSMRIKSESPAELLGFQRALDARTAQLQVPAGPRTTAPSTTRTSSGLTPDVNASCKARCSAGARFDSEGCQSRSTSRA